MKILCCIDSLAPGGAERQIVSLAIMLKEIGHEVEILVTHAQSFYLPQLREYGIGYIYLQAENKFTRLPKVLKAIRVNKPDIVVTYMRSMGIMAGCAKLLGQYFKLIVSERNISEENKKNNRLSFKERLKFFLYRWSDFIVCNSYTQTEFVRKNYPNLKYKLKTIINFIDLKHFYPSIEEKYKKNFLNILVAARVAPQKNVLCFLDAVKLLAEHPVNFKISWFGCQKNSNYYELCLEKVKKMNLNNYISFYPPTDQIEKEYQKADLLCLPSLYEGCPNAVCEAMASGVPISCSDVSDNSRIVEEGRNGFLFDPTSPEDIARAFEKFFSLSTEEKMMMGKASRLLAEQKFSKEKFLKSYEFLINE